MVELNKSIPYDLNVNPYLSEEALLAIDPSKLRQAQYDRGGAPVGPETAKQYAEAALRPGIASDLWSKNFALKRAQLANQKILNQERIDVGQYGLDTQKSIFKQGLINKSIGDAIKMAFAAYGGYSSATESPYAGESYDPYAANSFHPDISQIGGFWQSGMGGALKGAGAYMYNPSNFGDNSRY